MDQAFRKNLPNPHYVMTPTDYEYQSNFIAYPDHMSAQNWNTSPYSPGFGAPPQIQYPGSVMSGIPGPHQYYQGQPGNPGMTINVHTHFIPTQSQAPPAPSLPKFLKPPATPTPPYSAVSGSDSDAESRCESRQAMIQEQEQLSPPGSNFTDSTRCDSVMSYSTNDRKRGRKRIEQTEEERLAKRQRSNRESQRKSRELKKKALDSLATDNSVLLQKNAAIGSTLNTVVSLMEAEYVRRGGMDYEFAQLYGEVARLKNQIGSLGDMPSTSGATRRH